MAESADNLVIRILREIQSTQKDHTLLLEAHTREFERLRNGQKEIRESIVTALGLSAHANVRNDVMEDRIGKLEAMIQELADLRARVSRLETHNG